MLYLWLLFLPFALFLLLLYLFMMFLLMFQILLLTLVLLLAMDCLDWRVEDIAQDQNIFSLEGYSFQRL